MTFGCKFVERAHDTVDFRMSATAILSARARFIHDASGNLAEFARGQLVPFGQFTAFALWDGRAGLLSIRGPLVHIRGVGHGLILGLRNVVRERFSATVWTPNTCALTGTRLGMLNTGAYDRHGVSLQRVLNFVGDLLEIYSTRYRATVVPYSPAIFFPGERLS